MKERKGKMYLKFKQLITEGGNIKVKSVSGDTVGAEDIDLNKHDRASFKQDFKGALSSLSNHVRSKTGKHLFGNTGNIKTGSIFAGSTRDFMRDDISDEEYKKYKPSVGDMDLMYDRQHKEKMEQLLEPGKKFGKFTLVGTKKHGSQISAIMRHDEHGTHHQVDFEPAEYQQEKPNEFAQFSHSSDWNDTKTGVKGLFHKQFLSALTAAHGTFGTLRTKKGDADKFLEKHTFSIDKGLREKHQQVDTHPTTGHPIVTEVQPKDATYTNSVHDIYNHLLGKPPRVQSDLQQFGSFHGAMALAKQHLTSEQHGRVIDKFVHTLYHPDRAQMISPDRSKDEAMKDRALGFVRQQFPEHFSDGMRNSEIANMKKQFYEKKAAK